MFSAPFVRRYRSPLAILKISGSQSSLSNWLKQPVIKNINFELTLAQRQPHSMFRGNQQELEQLIDRVTTEIDNLVAMPGAQPTAIGQLVSHNLTIGNQSVTIETLELADLGEVLSQYQDEIMALDELQPSSPISVRWAYGAAGLILAVGSTFAISNYYDNSQNGVSDEGTISMVEPQGDARLNPEQNEVIPPQLPPELAQKSAESSQKPESQSNNPSAPTTASSPPSPITAPPSPITLPQDAMNSSKGNGQNDQGQGQMQPINSPKTIQRPPITVPPSQPIPPMPAPPVTSIPELESQFSEEQNALARANRSSTINVEPKHSGLAHTLQLSQAENYFADRWEVPANLNQSLQYRLDLATNGTVTKITPIGTTSSGFLDRVPLPQVGKSLVSPLPEPKLMRVVLNPDGTIQTFYE
ncbi:MAG: DUF4335 domain-containing protein [Synechococcaceae cyanobacterium RL_1_2]|nr:DUF4335 domain-containing protein [Synechococcaceae cyanobacterium RL_1_2]